MGEAFLDLHMACEEASDSLRHFVDTFDGSLGTICSYGDIIDQFCDPTWEEQLLLFDELVKFFGATT